MLTTFRDGGVNSEGFDTQGFRLWGNLGGILGESWGNLGGIRTDVRVVESSLLLK